MTLYLTIIYFAWLCLGVIAAFFLIGMIGVETSKTFQSTGSRKSVSRYTGRPMPSKVSLLLADNQIKKLISILFFGLLIFIVVAIALKLSIALVEEDPQHGHHLTPEPFREADSYFGSDVPIPLKTENFVWLGLTLASFITAFLCAVGTLIYAIKYLQTSEKSLAGKCILTLVCTVVSTVIAILTYFELTPYLKNDKAVPNSTDIIIINNFFPSERSAEKSKPIPPDEKEVPNPKLFDPYDKEKPLSRNNSRIIFASYFQNESDTLSEAQISVLKPLGDSLRGCIDQRTKGNDPLTLEFKGYTSSSPFDADSDKNNFILSKLRAQALSKALGLKHSPPAVNIYIYEWNTNKSASLKRPIDDLYDPLGERTPMEMVNRVATIELVESGLCKIKDDK